MKDARLLAAILREPSHAAAVEDWTSLLCIARAESLLGSLAYRLEGAALPDKVATMFRDARSDALYARTQALWEAEMARRALANVTPVILLKGTAYAAAGLDAGVGRSIGDLDILVPRARLAAAEQALLGAGWEWVKENPYDDHYYRTWMHELPPLIHRERDRMIDVHHTILPLTARPTPDVQAMIEDSLVLDSGLHVLAPCDMVVHSAAHLFADGDLSGGLRNLWDIDRLLRAFAGQDGFWPGLFERARRHQLLPQIRRAMRLAASLYGTPVDPAVAGGPKPSDRVYVRRLLARDGWGRAIRPAERFGFYLRSHLLRMPPTMLARHLLKKARR